MDIVFPGAIGAAVLNDVPRIIAAPRLGTGLPRLMHAWSEQNPRLLSSDVRSSDAFVRKRDIRDRVSAIAPIFAIAGTTGAIPTAHGILWVLDLYSVSATYPLSAPRQLANTPVTYRRHAATAYVSGGTATTIIVPDSTLDPIARAWFADNPGRYIAPRVPPQLLSPPPVAAVEPGAASSLEEQQFRHDVARIYTRMRAALDSGNLRAFGSAFDSLGIVIRGRR